MLAVILAFIVVLLIMSFIEVVGMIRDMRMLSAGPKKIESPPPLDLSGLVPACKCERCESIRHSIRKG